MIPVKPLKPKRLKHCLSVAGLCSELALCYGYDPMKAAVCGLYHDVAREIPKADMLTLAKERGIPIGKEEAAEPLLLHGALAACVMAENYGICDEELLNAVRRHTVGSAEMTLIDKILFFADKTEPLRTYEGVTELRELGFTDLNKALYQAVLNEIAYCGEMGYPVHPDTVKMKTNLEKQKEL